VIAYVDTSSIVAIAFRQPGYESIATKLSSFEQLFTSTLLEAELRATLARAGIADNLINLPYLRRASIVRTRNLHGSTASDAARGRGSS
jgi:uncharacterized protein with PIN domain